MSSRRGGKQPIVGPSNSLPSKGKSTIPHGYSSGVSGGSSANTRVDQLSHDMTKTSIDSTQTGDWEVFSKNSKNRASGNAKPGPNQNFTPNAWGHPNVVQKLGMHGNGGIGRPTGVAWQVQPASGHPYRGLENNYYAPPTSVAPPLQHGWQWGARPGSSGNPTQVFDEDSGSDTGGQLNQSEDEDDDLVEDDDDLMSDEFDSDGSVKSHETRKNHKWFKSFFEVLDKLTVEQLNEPSRQWHCPACKNGPGAIDWYRGLQPLITHAKTKGSKRVKLHRELAELLDEELIRKGTSAIPAGEVFGNWEGLRETVPDREIIWPPMVVIMNTLLTKDENDEKWIGMGNQELLDYFSSYEKAVKARHSYGPQGHRGMSILIFESSAVGYLEAECLHKNFASQGTGRDVWDKHQYHMLFKPGGKRQLYGYLATKDDLDKFNKHCQGKTKLKFEQRSHQEMVVVPMKQMSEDNQELVWLKNRVVKEQRHSKVLEESFGVLSQKYRKTLEENRIVKERSQLQFDENKAEMDYQDEFLKSQLSIIHQALEDKERLLEERLQEERKKINQSNVDLITQEEKKLRQVEIAELIQAQATGVQEFEGERENLMKMHEQKKADMKHRHMAEEVDLEREFEKLYTGLMERYTPHSPEEGAPGS